MKTRILIMAACMALLASINSCKKSTSPTPVENATKLLVDGSPWKPSSVTVDGVDKSDTFSSLTLSFSSTAFTSSNGAPVWPGAGTWKFDDASAKTFTRDDGLVVTIESLSSGKLTLTLTWAQPTYGPGRTTSISGKYIFNLAK